MKTWYAIMKDRDDDWGTGSYNMVEAIEMADSEECDIIAAIENDVCVAEYIRNKDF